MQCVSVCTYTTCKNVYRLLHPYIVSTAYNYSVGAGCTTVGAVPLVTTWRQCCCTNRGVNADERKVRGSRWAEEGWHFLDGAQEAVSSHIPSQYTPHGGTHITHPAWLEGRGAHPWLTKWISQQTSKPARKGRWPGRFVYAGRSILIMHGGFGHKVTPPVALYLGGELLRGDALSFKLQGEISDTPPYSPITFYISFCLTHRCRGERQLQAAMITETKTRGADLKGRSELQNTSEVWLQAAAPEGKWQKGKTADYLTLA